MTLPQVVGEMNWEACWLCEHQRMEKPWCTHSEQDISDNLELQDEDIICTLWKPENKQSRKWRTKND